MGLFRTSNESQICGTMKKSHSFLCGPLLDSWQSSLVDAFPCLGWRGTFISLSPFSSIGLMAEFAVRAEIKVRSGNVKSGRYAYTVPRG